MKRLLLFLLLILACPTFAQNQTTVTGTLTDPNGIAYYPATVRACLSPSTLNPKVGGNSINLNQGSNYCIGPVSTSSSGLFQMALYTNASITPAATSWIFTVQAAGTPPPVGNGTLNFSSAGVTISGTSQDVSANINSVGAAQFRTPSFAILNGDYVTGSATYPATGAGLQAAITAAANLGCVYAIRATYTLSTPLTIPSNSCIYWDNATISSNGYNGDMVQSTGTSNITFRGKLILNGSAMGTGTIGQGLNFVNVNNFSFDDIEGNGSTDGCLLMVGTSHVRGNKVYLQNCGKNNSTTASFFIANNSTTPSTDFMINEIEIDTPTGGAPIDCFYISGTSATPSLRINIASIILNGCTDSAFEANFTQGMNIGKIVAQASFNSAVLIRRGDTDVNIESIACTGAVAYKICLDIANFQAGDPSEQRIAVGQVTATNASSDVVNGAAVRISNSITTSSLTNISIGTLVADTSTRGFYCVAGTTHNAHISIGNLITHNNLGDGIKMSNCDDITGGSWISFDNKVGGTSDNGNAINIQGGATGNIAAVNVFDDRGGSKLQPFGFLADGTTTNWFIGVFGCQDALEVTGCLSNGGTGNEFIRKKDATDRVRFDLGTADFSGSVVMLGLSDFASQSFGKTFEDINATNCTNGELALSAGWGTTAAPTAAAGHGQTCQWTITSSGTGQAANPTLTDTLTQALGSATTVCEMRMVGGTGTATLINQTTLSATAPVFTFGGTPVAASTYFVVRRCGP